MKIRGIDMTKKDHDLVLARLRKKNVGTEDKPILEDDLTIEQWLTLAENGRTPVKDAWDQKLARCKNQSKE